MGRCRTACSILSGVFVILNMAALIFPILMEFHIIDAGLFHSKDQATKTEFVGKLFSECEDKKCTTVFEDKRPVVIADGGTRAGLFFLRFLVILGAVCSVLVFFNFIISCMCGLDNWCCELTNAFLSLVACICFALPCIIAYVANGEKFGSQTSLHSDQSDKVKFAYCFGKPQCDETKIGFEAWMFDGCAGLNLIIVITEVCLSCFLCERWQPDYYNDDSSSAGWGLEMGKHLGVSMVTTPAPTRSYRV